MMQDTLVPRTIVSDFVQGSSTSLDKLVLIEKKMTKVISKSKQRQHGREQLRFVCPKIYVNHFDVHILTTFIFIFYI